MRILGLLTLIVIVSSCSARQSLINAPQKPQLDSGQSDPWSVASIDSPDPRVAIPDALSIRLLSDGHTTIAELYCPSGIPVHGVLAEIHYPAQQLRFLSAEPIGGLASGCETALLTAEPRSGVLQLGCCLTKPLETIPVTGGPMVRAKFCSLRFTMPVPETTVIASGSSPKTPGAPSSSQELIDASIFESVYPLIRWRYVNPGDYDQNGEVGLSDLVPLVMHLEESSGGEGFAFVSIQSVVDGDGNGEINLGDLTVIGQNFGDSASQGFRVFASDRGVLEFEAPPPEIEVGSISFADAMGSNRASERMLCEYTAPVDQLELLGKYFYILLVKGPSFENGDLQRVIVPWPPTSGGERMRIGYIEAPATLSWYYYNQCDGNQDGQVDFDDLEVIEENFGRTWYEPHAVPWDIMYLLDFDFNGEVNISDLTPMGPYFGRKLIGYLVFSSPTLDAYPASPMEPASIGALGYMPFAPDPDTGSVTERQLFTFTLPSRAASQYCWVRPVGPGFYQGAASDPVHIEPVPW